VVQLATHRAQAGFDVAQTLTVGQLSKSHGQILVAAREAPMVRISAVTLNTLLELVGGQVIHELGEDSLSGIHPSLSAIRAVAATPWITSVLLRSFQIGKVELYAIAFNMCWL
jgi:hypothetical protein